MALQLSIDEKNRRGQVCNAKKTSGAVMAWTFAHTSAMCKSLERAMAAAIERIKSAGVHTRKRKQMKLVESLPLGNRRQLLLIVCDKQKYLVGAGADSVGSILAMDSGATSRDRAAKGPELVRRRGRDAAHEARSKTASQTGPALWH